MTAEVCPDAGVASGSTAEDFASGHGGDFLAQATRDSLAAVGCPEEELQALLELLSSAPDSCGYFEPPRGEQDRRDTGSKSVSDSRSSGWDVRSSGGTSGSLPETRMPPSATALATPANVLDMSPSPGPPASEAACSRLRSSAAAIELRRDLLARSWPRAPPEWVEELEARDLLRRHLSAADVNLLLAAAIKMSSSFPRPSSASGLVRARTLLAFAENCEVHRFEVRIEATYGLDAALEEEVDLGAEVQALRLRCKLSDFSPWVQTQDFFLEPEQSSGHFMSSRFDLKACFTVPLSVGDTFASAFQGAHADGFDIEILHRGLNGSWSVLTAGCLAAAELSSLLTKSSTKADSSGATEADSWGPWRTQVRLSKPGSMLGPRLLSCSAPAGLPEDRDGPCPTTVAISLSYHNAGLADHEDMPYPTCHVETLGKSVHKGVCAPLACETTTSLYITTSRISLQLQALRRAALPWLEILGLPALHPAPRLALQARFRQSSNEEASPHTCSEVLCFPAFAEVPEDEEWSASLKTEVTFPDSSDVPVELWLQLRSSCTGISAESSLLAELRLTEEMFPLRELVSLHADAGWSEPIMASMPFELQLGEPLAKLELCITPLHPRRPAPAPAAGQPPIGASLLEGPEGGFTRSSKESTLEYAACICEVWLPGSLCPGATEELCFYIEMIEHSAEQSGHRRCTVPTAVSRAGSRWLRLCFGQEWLVTANSSASSFEVFVYGIGNAFGEAPCALAKASLELEVPGSLVRRRWISLTSNSGVAGGCRMLVTERWGRDLDVPSFLPSGILLQRLQPAERDTPVLLQAASNLLLDELHLDCEQIGSHVLPGGLIQASAVRKALLAEGRQGSQAVLRLLKSAGALPEEGDVWVLFSTILHWLAVLTVSQKLLVLKDGLLLLLDSQAGSSGFVPGAVISQALAHAGVSDTVLRFIETWEPWAGLNGLSLGREFDCVAFVGEMLSSWDCFGKGDDCDAIAPNGSACAEDGKEGAERPADLARGSQEKVEESSNLRQSKSLEAPSVVLQITNAFHLPLVREKCPNTFVSYSWQVSREPVECQAELGQTEVIYRTTCPAWDYRATVPLPQLSSRRQLAYPASLGEVALQLSLWHVDTLRGDAAGSSRLLLGTAVAPLSPLLSGFEELDGYFHLAAAQQQDDPEHCNAATEGEGYGRGQIRLKLRVSVASLCSSADDKDVGSSKRSALPSDSESPLTRQALGPSLLPGHQAEASAPALSSFSSARPASGLGSTESSTGLLGSSAGLLATQEDLGVAEVLVSLTEHTDVVRCLEETEARHQGAVSVVSDGSLDQDHFDAAGTPSAFEGGLADDVSNLENARAAFRKNIDELDDLQRSLLSRFGDGHSTQESEHVEEVGRVEDKATEYCLGDDQSERLGFPNLETISASSKGALAELLQVQRPASCRMQQLQVPAEADIPDEPEPAAEDAEEEIDFMDASLGEQGVEQTEKDRNSEDEQWMTAKTFPPAPAITVDSDPGPQKPEHDLGASSKSCDTPSGLLCQGAGLPPARLSIEVVSKESKREASSLISQEQTEHVQAASLVESSALSTGRRRPAEGGRGPLPASLQIKQVQDGTAADTSATTAKIKEDSGAHQEAVPALASYSTAAGPCPLKQLPVEADVQSEHLEESSANAACQTTWSVIQAVSHEPKTPGSPERPSIRQSQSTPPSAARAARRRSSPCHKESRDAVNWDSIAAVLSNTGRTSWQTSPARGSMATWSPGLESDLMASPGSELGSEGASLATTARGQILKPAARERPQKWGESVEHVKTKRLARIMRGAPRGKDHDSDSWSSSD